jgi:hypothetical protein
MGGDFGFWDLQQYGDTSVCPRIIPHLLDLSTLQVNARLHDFPWMGRKFA